MKKIRYRVRIGLACVVLAGSLSLWVLMGLTQTKQEDILAKVGDTLITNDDLNMMIDKFKSIRRARPLSIDEKKVMLDNLVKAVLIVQEAERLQLDKKPSVEKKIKQARNEILMAEYAAVQVESKVKVTDADVENYLKDFPDLIPKENLMLKEILVKTEKEANEIVRELQKGADFSKLAVDKSIAPSRRHGGHMGMIPKGRLPKAVEEVAFKLEEGKFSKPIKIEQGYIILYLDKKKERTKQEIDELTEKVKAKVFEILKRQKVSEMMDKKVQEVLTSIKVEKYYDRIK